MKQQILKLIMMIAMVFGLFGLLSPTMAQAAEKYAKEQSDDGTLRPASSVYYDGFYYTIYPEAGSIVRYSKDGKNSKIIYSLTKNTENFGIFNQLGREISDRLINFVIYNDTFYISVGINNTQYKDCAKEIFTLSLDGKKKETIISYDLKTEPGEITNWCIWKDRIYVCQSLSVDCYDLNGKKKDTKSIEPWQKEVIGACYAANGPIYNGELYFDEALKIDGKYHLYKMNLDSGEVICYKTLGFQSFVSDVSNKLVFMSDTANPSDTRQWWTVSSEGDQTSKYIGKGMEELWVYQGDIFFYLGKSYQELEGGTLYKSKGLGGITEETTTKLLPTNYVHRLDVVPTNDQLILDGEGYYHKHMLSMDGKMNFYRLYDWRATDNLYIPAHRKVYTQYTYLSPKVSDWAAKAVARRTFNIVPVSMPQGDLALEAGTISESMDYWGYDYDYTAKVNRYNLSCYMIDTMRILQDTRVMFWGEMKYPNEDITYSSFKFSDTPIVSCQMMAAYGIINVKSGGKYQPNRLVTREELAEYGLKLMTAYNKIYKNYSLPKFKFKKKNISNYTDYSKVTSSRKNAMEICYGMGLFYDSGKKLAPKSICTKEEVIYLCDKLLTIMNKPTSDTKQLQGSKITKLEKGRNSFTVTWAKDKYATKYIIRYSTKTDMSNAKSVTVSSDKLSNTISSLVSGKQYYVQVRSYCKKASKNFADYYECTSAWSKRMSVTVN